MYKDNNPESTSQIIQNDLLTRLVGVSEFINEINIEKIDMLEPLCCKASDCDCRHEVKQVHT